MYRKDTGNAVEAFVDNIRDRVGRDVYERGRRLAQQYPERILEHFDDLPEGWLGVGDDEHGTASGKFAVYLYEEAEREMQRRRDADES